MDVNRAKEIINSSDKIDVEWDGVPVWIDSVDSTTQIATVHEENKPTVSQTVDVNRLQEKKMAQHH